MSNDGFTRIYWEMPGEPIKVLENIISFLKKYQCDNKISPKGNLYESHSGTPACNMQSILWEIKYRDLNLWDSRLIISLSQNFLQTSVIIHAAYIM